VLELRLRERVVHGLVYPRFGPVQRPAAADLQRDRYLAERLGVLEPDVRGGCVRRGVRDRTDDVLRRRRRDMRRKRELGECLRRRRLRC
jgi:hypothetical protein